MTASHLLASGTTVIADTAALTKYLVSIAGGLSVAAGFAATTLRRRRRARAQLLKTGWQGASGGEGGAVVYNESPVDFKDIVLTVACAQSSREARQDVGLLRAKTDRLLPAGVLHQAMTSGGDGSAGDVFDAAHLAYPHEVHATFADGKSYWHRDNSQQVMKIRDLTIWAEATRAQTLRTYFGRRSPFQKSFALRVHVESFERTEQLEAAFTTLAAGGRAPDGVKVPDLVVGPHDWIGRIATEDSVLEPPPSLGRLRAVSPNALAALSRNGRLYAVPYVSDSVALIRNDALASGPMPSTLGDVLESGRRLLAERGIRDGAALALQVGAPDPAGNAGDPYHLWPLFSSLGGSFFGRRGGPDAGFDEPEQWRPSFVEAFVELSRLGTGDDGSGTLRPEVSRSRSLEMFLDGRAPYLLSSSRALKAIRQKGLQVTVAPVPRLGDRPAVPMVSVYGFFIYRGAPHLPAARDLLTTYMQRPSAGLDLQKIQQLVPVQSEAMAAVAASDPVLAAYVTQCRDGMVMPSYPEMRDAWRLLGQTEYDVLAGIGDPRERAGRAADEGWRMLEAARAGA